MGYHYLLGFFGFEVALISSSMLLTYALYGKTMFLFWFFCKIQLNEVAFSSNPILCFFLEL